MPDRSMTQPHMSDQGTSTDPGRGSSAAPEPLQTSTGPMGAGGITLVALVVAAILGVVFWGLNSPQNTEHVAGGAPAAQSKQPAGGGNAGAPTPGAPPATRSGNG